METLAKKNCQNGGEGITRENMGYCKQDGLGAEKEMGFFDKIVIQASIWTCC